jgi:ABC-type sulfate/molybdate transport systems ATPase subunit
VTKGWVNCRLGDFTLDVQWEVPAGSILVLFGASGSGKTTALRTIAGLLHPLKGHVEIGEAVVYDHELGVWLPPHRRRVGYVPQEYLLFQHLDVSGNIGYGLQDVETVEKQRRISELVSAFRLEGLERRRVWELSGGQQ